MYGYGNSYNNQRPFYPYYNNNNINEQNRINQFQPIQQMPMNQLGLFGKSVDSIEVVKAMDIPLDGSISYFPLTDGSAIVTKQLQNDGTSRTIVYKPINNEKKQDEQYLTLNEFENKIAEFDIESINDIKDLKDELKNMKKEIEKMKTIIKGDKK